MAPLPGHDVPDTSLENELSNHCGDLKAGLSNVRGRRSVCLYLDRKNYRAVLHREVQLLPQTSLAPVKLVKENIAE